MTAATDETIERIGVCRAKGTKSAAMFHRLKKRLSRKYRVWPVPGDDRSLLLDPSEFVDRYVVIQWYAPPPEGE